VRSGLIHEKSAACFSSLSLCRSKLRLGRNIGAQGESFGESEALSHFPSAAAAGEGEGTGKSLASLPLAEWAEHSACLLTS
jgi:hypothetical protein